jgi:hypothetical protein
MLSRYLSQPLHPEGDVLNAMKAGSPKHDWKALV